MNIEFRVRQDFRSR